MVDKICEMDRRIMIKSMERMAWHVLVNCSKGGVMQGYTNL